MKKRLICPQCGCEDLKITSIQKPASRPSAFLIILCIFSSLITFFLLASFLGDNGIRSVEDLIKSISSYGMRLGALFTCIIALVISISFMVTRSYKVNELYYICPCCLMHNTVRSLIPRKLRSKFPINGTYVTESDKTPDVEILKLYKDPNEADKKLDDDDDDDDDEDELYRIDEL